MQSSEKAKEVINANVVTGASQTVDVDVSGFTLMLVLWRLVAGAAAGDLTLNVVKPYNVDGTTVHNQALVPKVAAVAPALVGADVLAMALYDVGGMHNVKIESKNNNAGTKAIAVQCFLTP